MRKLVLPDSTRYMNVMADAVNGPLASSAPQQTDLGRGWLIGLICLILATRLCVLVVGYTSARTAAERAEPQFNREHPWIAWDAQHYYEIALNGYSPDRIGRPFKDATTFALAAYFPVMPLISRGLSHFIPLDLAMVALSNVCSLVGFVFLYDWARRLAGRWTAWTCVLVAATFPGAVAFAAGMTEGPFLMFVSITLWLLERKRFIGAAVVTGIATALRPTGVALAMLVPLYVLVQVTTMPFPRRAALAVALGAICCIGGLCYESFLWHRYQSPTAYLDAQKNWPKLDEARLEREKAGGVRRYSWEFFKARMARPQSLNVGIALVLLLVCISGLTRPMGIPRVLFVFPLVIFVMTALPDRGLRISSMPRYESAAIPLFLLVATWFTPRRMLPLLVCFLCFQFALQLYYAYLFPREIWVG